MQIVIDISEETIRSCKSINWANIRPEQVDDMELAIANGIVLPEHHGNLKDETDIIKSLFAYTAGIKTIGQCLESVPTIIPATEEGGRNGIS